MRVLMVAVIWMCLLCQAWCTEPVFTHVFRDDNDVKISLYDSVGIWIDWSNDLDIHTILGSTDIEFAHPDPDIELKVPFSVWLKLELVNATAVAREEYFSYCLDADSVWVYGVSNGHVTDEKITGSAIDRIDKSIPSMYSYSFVSLDAGEARTYYIRMQFNRVVTQEHLTHVLIQPAKPLIHRVMSDYAWHSFYAGIMLLFGLFSLFMYFMFREKEFIFFGSLMIFFGLYFLKNYGVVDAFFFSNYRSSIISFGQSIVSGIILSLSFFMYGYIGLKKQLPVFYRVHLYFTIFSALYAHVGKLIFGNLGVISYSHNFIAMIWIVLTIVPIIILARRKDESARVLLISIGFLFLGSSFFLLSSQNIVQTNSFMKYGFQIGTIIFSGVLFFGLFDKINSIRREKERFEELDQFKSRFFANISHEFRTPLTLMMAPLSQLKEQVDREEDKVLLDMALRNADRQLLLVNQLLDLSRLDAGKMAIQASEEDFIPQLKGIVYSYESLASRKNIHLSLDCPYEELPLYFERDKIEKIFYNLLSNAFKFTPAGGEILVWLKKGKNEISIGIQDTGVGIEEERLPFIFERFFQADPGKSENQEGSGIGLALAKELVQLHSGSIQVQSVFGKGTTFTVTLPLGSAHLKPEEILVKNPTLAEISYPSKKSEAIELSEDQKMAASLLKAPNGAARILLIEDNEDMRFFISQRLESAFSIIEAKDGAEGIRQAIKHMPDLIISDVMMPKKNGYEVCQALKTDVRTSHIPIILLTAKAAQEDKQEGLETGADDYLLKPFDLKELETRVKNLIQIR
ncbi:MAG: response regulator, partial [Saprospiraceae bacterium]|nr:response regulator [Saprospiraceae bacterium]